MDLKFFYQKDCAKCELAHKVLNEIEKRGVWVSSYDQNDGDGRAEGAYHLVMATPTILLVDENDKEIAEWRGVVPTLEDLIREISLTTMI